MAIQLFGFEFKRKDPNPDPLPSFTPKDTDDGAAVIAAGGAYGTYVDMDGSIRTEAELVTKYREMSLHPECDSAVDEIVNESISVDEEDIVEINLDKTELSDKIKDILIEEFNNCLKILDFHNYAYEIYRRWYIDGRLYYHVIIDDKDLKAGIKEVRYIDPRKIRKIREIQKKRINVSDPGDSSITKIVNEYFIYNEKGFNYGNKVVGPSTSGLKIAKDSIIHIVSGLTDNQGTLVLSYLHKAIKALNQLRTLEDALVIYRLSRAPERRIWYIDVGNLPKMKAEQYVRDIMVKHKNRLVYDANSGEVKDDRKFMTMLEDYWLPRREGGRGTEVTTLPGGQTLGQMDDVLYFQKKFLNCLNVPVSRLNSDALFSLGRATEITRDELKFSRFVSRLRQKFSILFLKMLEKQVVLKGIMSIEDWEQLEPNIRFDYAKDNYFTELKDAEILQNRTELADRISSLVGKYYSHEYVRKNILHQTDEDIKEQDKEIKRENNSGDPRWINTQIEQNIDMMGQLDMAQHSRDNEMNNNNEQNDKMEELKQAMGIIAHLETKKSNKTPQEKKEYRSAIQLIAKNKDLINTEL